MQAVQSVNKKGRDYMSGGRLLTLDEQIEHLKAKGITFQSYTEEAAKHFLSEHNYLTKVSAYRKNYTQHPAGPNQGKYVRLDFATWLTYQQLTCIFVT